MQVYSSVIGSLALIVALSSLVWQMYSWRRTNRPRISLAFDYPLAYAQGGVSITVSGIVLRIINHGTAPCHVGRLNLRSDNESLPLHPMRNTDIAPHLPTLLEARRWYEVWLSTGPIEKRFGSGATITAELQLQTMEAIRSEPFTISSNPMFRSGALLSTRPLDI
jgi:hypothetical protein